MQIRSCDCDIMKKQNGRHFHEFMALTIFFQHDF